MTQVRNTDDDNYNNDNNNNNRNGINLHNNTHLDEIKTILLSIAKSKCFLNSFAEVLEGSMSYMGAKGGWFENGRVLLGVGCERNEFENRVGT